jgi:hypothetical protein
MIALGKRLAAQLDDDDDIAANWLAHLLAERLTAVETAPDAEAKAVAEAGCTGLIMELWRQQAAFPNHKRPFRDLDVVLRTIESLDTDNPASRYYPSPFRSAGGDAVPEAPRQWLELALGVDATARQLIRAALGMAVGAMGDEMQDWVALARAASADDPAEARVIRFVLDGGEQDDLDVVREQRQRQLGRLEEFIALAQLLAKDLAAKLDEADAGAAKQG